jgi:hypothetical protein
LAFPGAPTSKTDEFVVDDVVALVAFEVDAVVVVLLFWFNDGDADDGDVAVKMDRLAKTVIMAAAIMIKLKVTVFLAFSS